MNIDIPKGTVVRIIDKENEYYNKIMITYYKDYFDRYVCFSKRGSRIYNFYRDGDLEVISYYDNKPFPNSNFRNDVCYFCGIKNKYFKIKDKYFYYCPKCLR